MAINVGEKATKVRLVHSVLNEEGKSVKKSTTYSNIKRDISNDVLMTGVKAMTKLLKEAPAEIRRVDEAVLTEM